MTTTCAPRAIKPCACSAYCSKSCSRRSAGIAQRPDSHPSHQSHRTSGPGWRRPAAPHQRSGLQQPTPTVAPSTRTARAPLRSPQINCQRQPRRKQHQHKSHPPRARPATPVAETAGSSAANTRCEPPLPCGHSKLRTNSNVTHHAGRRQPCAPHRATPRQRAHQQNAGSKQQRHQAEIRKPRDWAAHPERAK